jgi:branched-chain amino acid transport system permease protein
VPETLSTPLAAPRAASIASRWRTRKLPLLLALLALAAVWAGAFSLPEFTQNTLVRTFLYASVAITVDILWGYTGILTFGQAAFFGIGAYAAGLTFTHLGWSPANAVFALLGGAAVSMLVAALVGLLSFYPGASPLYASVVSLVLPIVVTQLIFSGGAFTGSSSGLSGFETFELEMWQWFCLTGSFLVALTFAAWLFVNGDTGRLLKAIRENESRCEYVGIDTSRVKTLLTVGLSVVCSVAGFLFATYSMVVSPELAGFQLGTEILVWVALGGRGTLLGPVFGTLLIDTGSAYLSGDLPFVWKLIVGIAFVAVIVAMPRGLLPSMFSGLRRLAGLDLPTPAARAGDSALRRRLRLAKERPLAGLQGKGRLALHLKGVARRFGSLQVLADVEFDARHGELLSLVGPNGAGKTTLMRCISDGRERSAGVVQVNDHPIATLPPHACVAFGIGRKFQTANVFDTLTVFDALAVARTRMKRPEWFDATSEIELPEPALRIIETTGLDRMLDVECRLLSHGQKQALELAMVLALEPSVVLLDEPTAGLTKPERTEIGETLQSLARDHHMCVVLIEHDLDFVCAISSRVIVLHQGRIVLDGSVTEVVESELVREIYAGSAALPADAGAERANGVSQ